MSTRFVIKSANTILYCRRWSETVAFYQNVLNLPITYRSDWFIEFEVTAGAYVSVANERRATLKSSLGQGLTLTFQVEDIDAAWQHLHQGGAASGPIKNHAWGARVFHFFDPEGHRLEIWAPPQPETT